MNHIYKLPPSKKNGLKMTDFLIEIEEFLSNLNIDIRDIIVWGFNFHINDAKKPAEKSRK